ncbi:MAG TPA: hypothetical protein VKD08_08565 [Ignavibacteriaceae bacterium]|nr:hypothetical protein [Ignavibacteriaceae bacterium]
MKLDINSGVPEGENSFFKPDINTGFQREKVYSSSPKLTPVSRGRKFILQAWINTGFPEGESLVFKPDINTGFQREKVYSSSLILTPGFQPGEGNQIA